MTIGIYNDVLSIDEWRYRWSEDKVSSYPIEHEPQWGFVGHGQCPRCSDYVDLWTVSNAPEVYDDELLRCMPCTMYRLDWYMSMSASLASAYLYVRNPNTWDIEASEDCVACGKGFPSDDQLESVRSGVRPIMASDRNGDEFKVHYGCASYCGSCDSQKIGYAIPSRRDLVNRHIFTDVEHEAICGDCHTEYVTQAGGPENIGCCHNCSTIVASVEMYEWMDYDYCHSCYEDYCHECTECDAQYVGDSYDHTCWEDDESSPYIHNYSYKPRPFFFGEGTYHMGFELEVEAKRNYPSTGAELVCRSLGERVYCKEDGSLDHGFEIVTHPHTLAEYQNEFDWSSLDRLRNEGFRSWDTSSCGLHVHVSRTAFGNPNSREDVLKVQAHELRFMKLIYDNQRQVQRLAGRSESTYATFEDRGKLIRKVKDGHQSNGRYSAINTDNEATLEVRIFRGSLKKERVLSAIELVGAAVEYTRDLKVAGSNKALSWLQFVSYVAQNMEQYPNLSNVIEKTFSTESISD
jgi:hypothetical protein